MLFSKEGDEPLVGYVMGLESDRVWVYFKGKPIETRKSMTFKEFFEQVRKPHLTEHVKIVPGLYNLGNSCYINAVIQCLLASPVLSNFL